MAIELGSGWPFDSRPVVGREPRQGGDTEALLGRIRRLGMRAGLAANPDTHFEALDPFLDQVDLVLCMTVFPGFAGQEFMGEVMDKVRDVRAAIDVRLWPRVAANFRRHSRCPQNL